MAKRQIQAIRQLVRAGQRTEVTARLYATITQYLQDRHVLTTSGLTRQQLTNALKQQGVADAEVNTQLTLLSEVELARYAPLQGGDSLPHWVSRLEQLISQSRQLRTEALRSNQAPSSNDEGASFVSDKL